MISNRSVFTITLLLLLVLAGTFIYLNRGYLVPVLPGSAVAANGIQHINLPPGFRIELYADNLPGARSLSMSPSGTLFVGTRREGKVYALQDRDNDYQADQIYTLASGLRMPNGVAFHNGDLYVAEVERVLRFPQIENSLQDPPKPIVVSTDYPDDEAHGWKFIAFGPDGKLYIPVGMPCNVCLPDEEIYGTITRLDPTGGRPEIFARGVRNSVGFDWHPQSGELWFTDNGRDWLGDDLPNDELNHAPQAGMHFGFPFCNQGDLADPDYGDHRPCSEFTPPALKLGPHVAALGMRFYRGSQFPEHYRGGIFIAQHGSWNRSEPIGYRVVFVPLHNNQTGPLEIFAQGWLRDGRASGRPVDLLELPDGSLLLSDDKGGRIYRIFYEKSNTQ